MVKTVLEPLSIEDIRQWSGMWREYWKNHNHVLRTHEEGFYRYKYFDNPYARAYRCLNEEGRLIGFCGIVLGQDRCGGRTAAFSDVIFDPAYRMQGLAKEFVDTVIHNKLKDCPTIVFFPIDRNSFITWRFMFRINEARVLHRWAVALDSREEEVAAVLSFQDANEQDIDTLGLQKDREYIRWRYFKHPTRHNVVVIEEKGQRIGYFAFITVLTNGVKGVEIGEIYIEKQGQEPAAYLREMMRFLQRQGFAYLILKVPKGSGYDCFLTGWERSRKVLEKKYALFPPGREQPGELEAGEEADVPRDAEFITNLI